MATDFTTLWLASRFALVLFFLFPGSFFRLAPRARRLFCSRGQDEKCTPMAGAGSAGDSDFYFPLARVCVKGKESLSSGVVRAKAKENEHRDTTHARLAPTKHTVAFECPGRLGSWANSKIPWPIRSFSRIWGTRHEDEGAKTFLIPPHLQPTLSFHDVCVWFSRCGFPHARQAPWCPLKREKSKQARSTYIGFASPAKVLGFTSLHSYQTSLYTRSGRTDRSFSDVTEDWPRVEKAI